MNKKTLARKPEQKQTLTLIFFHPDYTVGFGITPNHALRLVGYHHR